MEIKSHIKHESCRLSLKGKDLEKILKSNGMLPKNATCKIFAPVPGGGDWSYMNLDLDCDSEIVIDWEAVINDTYC